MGKKVAITNKKIH